jgi:hypothetical protein
MSSVGASLRHSRYDGFRATIRTVGTGVRGSRALTFDEARGAMAALLAGEVSDTQAGASREWPRPSATPRLPRTPR